MDFINYGINVRIWEKDWDVFSASFDIMQSRNLDWSSPDPMISQNPDRTGKSLKVKNAIEKLQHENVLNWTDDK